MRKLIRNRQGVLFDVAPSSRSFYEKRLAEDGIAHVAGVDEVGRGCLAGPVFAAAVILPYPCGIEGIKDSKKLSPRRRETLFDAIREDAISYAFGVIGPAEIDEINILRASLKAMKLAIESLPVRPGYILVDGSHMVPVTIPQLVVPKGDNRSVSVAAASILAKVERDRFMGSMEKDYPGFSFSVHKGYGTAQHLSELKRHGATPIHRTSFKGVVTP